MLNKLFAPFRAVMAFLAGLMLTAGVMAQTSDVDVSATVTSLGNVKTAVLSIGVAVLAIVVGIKLYKWVKQAL